MGPLCTLESGRVGPIGSRQARFSLAPMGSVPAGWNLGLAGVGLLQLDHQRYAGGSLSRLSGCEADPDACRVSILD